jgi:hypothetical protein
MQCPTVRSEICCSMFMPRTGAHRAHWSQRTPENYASDQDLQTVAARDCWPRGERLAVLSRRNRPWHTRRFVTRARGLPAGFFCWTTVKGTPAQPGATALGPGRS